MFAKLFITSPLVAVVSYMVAPVSRIDWKAIEQGLVDFIVVGHIPFSDVYISYEVLALTSTIGLWLSFTYRFTKFIIKRATKTVHTSNNFDLIAL